MLLTMADGVTEHREDERELHVHGRCRWAASSWVRLG